MAGAGGFQSFEDFSTKNDGFLFKRFEVYSPIFKAKRVSNDLLEDCLKTLDNAHFQMPPQSYSHFLQRG